MRGEYALQLGAPSQPNRMYLLVRRRGVWTSGGHSAANYQRVLCVGSGRGVPSRPVTKGTPTRMWSASQSCKGRRAAACR